MILHIICQDNLETVRYLYLDAEKQYVGATIGVGSYIVDASLEFGSLRGHGLPYLSNWKKALLWRKPVK